MYINNIICYRYNYYSLSYKWYITIVLYIYIYIDVISWKYLMTNVEEYNMIFEVLNVEYKCFHEYYNISKLNLFHVY